MPRCGWCGDDPLYIRYHDDEWGMPCRDEAKLFEFLILEGMQAGLSWLTVLRKREALRRALADFDPDRLLAFTAPQRAALLQDASIIRNRRKIAAVFTNAAALRRLHAAGGSLVERLWSPVGDRAVQNTWQSLRDVPSATPLAKALAGQLRRDGFAFVGPTICYAYMQAMGVVNDHLLSCPRHAQCARMA